MERSEKVFNAVRDLYLSDSGWNMGRWMWNNHVQWVADKARILAKKYSADIEKVYCAALLHDLGDSRFERGEKDFDTWSEDAGKEILKEASFNEGEITEIYKDIIYPHSCRPGNMPNTIEGKVLATADAVFHLQTNFFPALCHMGRPTKKRSYSEWQEWFEEKIERDFAVKIFFEEVRAEVVDDYNALRKVFGNKVLGDL